MKIITLSIILFINIAPIKAKDLDIDDGDVLEQTPVTEKQEFVQSFDLLDKTNEELNQQWMEDFFDAAINLNNDSPYEKAIGQWRFELMLSLLEHPSAELQAYALLYLSNTFLEEQSKDDKESQLRTSNFLIDKLDRYLQSNQLTKFNYSILFDVCENELFKPICKDYQFFSNAIKIDPNNLFSYANGLNLTDEGMAEKIKKINDVKNYSLTGMNKLIKEIKRYQAHHPIPLQDLDINAMNFMVKYFSSEQKRELDKAIKNFTPEYQIYNEASFLTATNHYSTFLRNLMHQCSQQEVNKSCLYISELLISEMDNVLNLTFGYYIQQRVLKINLQFEEYQKSLINYYKFKKYSSCITRNDVGMFGSFMLLHPVIQKVYVDNIEKRSELEIYKIVLESFQEYLTENNLSHLDSFENCSVINKLSDEEFIERYDLQDDLQQELDDFHDR